MQENYQLTVPESWIIRAVNLYLDTITVPSNQRHNCTSVQKTTDYQENLFCVNISRVIIVPEGIVAP